MTITVVLTEKAAASLAASGETSSAIDTVMAIIESHDASISPVHPGSDDPDLRRFLTAETSVDTDASHLIDELLACEAVDGAYVKPEEELP